MISVEEEISRLRELGTRREKDSFKLGNMKVITINFAFDLCKSSLNWNQLDFKRCMGIEGWGGTPGERVIEHFEWTEIEMRLRVGPCILHCIEAEK